MKWSLPDNFYAHCHAIMDAESATIANEISSYAESPIEVAFATAFVVLGGCSYGNVAVLERGYDREFVDHFDWQLRPQRDVGKYRVDFIASANPYNKRMGVVVECDGHNFHERTKKQAQRDRARDRYMQMDGWKVLRFTGSEIYRNPFDCAMEVFETLLILQQEAYP